MAITADFMQLLQVVKVLFASGGPFILLGGVALKLYLDNICYQDVVRFTVDIDVNITDASLTSFSLLEIINRCLLNIDNRLIAKIRHAKPDGRAVEVVVYNDYSKHIFLRLDISYSPVLTLTEYILDNCAIKAVMPIEILADKLTVLSTRSIMRRSKDLIDIFVLSNCLQLNFSEILYFITNKNINMGRFDEFLSNYETLEEHYCQLHNVVGKPDFQVMYDRIGKFISPFFSDVSDPEKMVWIPGHNEWVNKLN
jgi:predicted nucleotidyltransferase component of viral defense system